MRESKSDGLYDKDFYAWTIEQASLLDTKQLNKLDIRHLREELQIMGVSEKRELASRLEVLIMHLLKWQYQPDMQSNSWRRTIKSQRDRLLDHLETVPSLQSKVGEYIDKAYNYAVIDAANETGLAEETFPEHCAWSVTQILDKSFLP